MLSAVKSNKNAVLGNTTVKSNDKGVFVRYNNICKGSRPGLLFRWRTQYPYYFAPSKSFRGGLFNQL